MNLQFALAAALMLAAGGAMIAYEWVRIRAKRPILARSQAVVLYWVAYLSLLTLGLTAAVAAVVR